ncbi:VWA domain-containing protein [Parafrankia sp. EUN1f]|uniref:VWA domain-containing protein n=1 Tax=Parafrankia sp. EUN1f TaxID=102897 RepID=UPI0001C4434E|nr:VWA domain-containing protein [Parafrankia sp. EUN1f]EFC83430.1 conserved hypothetical protein [Parafrankia sp. EUN1f]
MSPGPPRFVTDLIDQLRRRAFMLGPEDVAALRQALAAGFGWSSRAALEDLCVTLWAKSDREADVVRAAFLRVDVPDLDPPAPAEDDLAGDLDASKPDAEPHAVASPGAEAVRADPMGGLPALPAPSFAGVDRRLVLVPRYPVSEREIAQAWRRVRRPVRVGPAVEVDVEASLRRRCDSGVATAPVLVARRRNAVRMLVLIDAGGSMTPYADYVQHVRVALTETARSETTIVRYFHNVPAPSPDRRLLDTLSDPFAGHLDEILRRISPLPNGAVYADPALTRAERLADLLDLDDAAATGGPTGAVVIGDAGAARGRYDPVRLLDTIALLKALRERCGRLVWLNPAPVGRWAGSTAGRVSRHVPMFPLATKAGLDAAVEALRGRSVLVDAPL